MEEIHIRLPVVGMCFAGSVCLIVGLTGGRKVVDITEALPLSNVLLAWRHSFYDTINTSVNRLREVPRQKPALAPKGIPRDDFAP